MKTSLVTGGAGFIGSHLAEALVTVLRHRVRIFDNFSTGTADNLERIERHVEIFEGDLRDYDAVFRAVDGVDYVFHYAAPVSDGDHLGNLVQTHAVGTTGTLHVLHAASRTRVRRVLYASSCCVYGEPTATPRHEGELPRPLVPYDVAKLAGEQQCSSFTSAFGLETVMLRYFNVYGPRQRPDSPYASQLTEMVTAMRGGQQPIISVHPHDLIDLINVDDVVHANLLAVRLPRVSGAIYNIGSGCPVPALKVVRLLNSVLDTDLQPLHVHVPNRTRTMHLANNHKAERELGFCAGTSLEKGLRRYLAQVSELCR